MTVDLFLVLLLHTEDDLSRHDPLIRVHESKIGIEAECSGVLEEVSSDRFIVHCILHVVAGLIHSQQCKTIKDTRVDFFATICDNADNNLGGSSLPVTKPTFCGEYLFPRVFPPRARVFPRTQVCNILHQTVYGPAE